MKPDDCAALNLYTSNLTIDFDNKLVNMNGSYSVPNLKRHFDCCGAELAWHHPYGEISTRSQALYNKLYFQYLRYTKANITVFLTDSQVPAFKTLYENVFGKDAIELVKQYENPNSGNIINVYFVNTLDRWLKHKGIKREDFKEAWTFRNEVTASLSNGVFSAPKESDHELLQWFENSELKTEVIGYKMEKPITIKSSDRIRRSAVLNMTGSTFMATPIRNYTTR